MFALFLAAGAVLQSCVPSPSGRPLLSVPPSAAADNDIYIADAMGNIRALRSDGSEIWHLSLADEITRVDPQASHDIRIDHLVARRAGKLFGLATELSGRTAGKTILFGLDDNRLVWQTAAPYPAEGRMPVALGADAVYESGADGVLYAFSRADGHRTWEYRVAEGAIGSPTVGADGSIYVTGPRFNLHAISPDGKERWVAGSK